MLFLSLRFCLLGLSGRGLRCVLLGIGLVLLEGVGDGSVLGESKLRRKDAARGRNEGLALQRSTLPHEGLSQLGGAAHLVFALAFHGAQLVKLARGAD